MSRTVSRQSREKNCNVVKTIGTREVNSRCTFRPTDRDVFVTYKYPLYKTSIAHILTKFPYYDIDL